MKAHAVTFALLMIASSLAGCTTAGTDGVPEVTLDDEDIETFLDDYFQDFVNNSSVVINQEIHYHNNTTVNEGDDTSSTSYSVNGSSGNSMLNVMTVEWDTSGLLPSIEDIRSHVIELDSDATPDGKTTTLVSLSYQGQNFEISDITCNQFWNYASFDSDLWREILDYDLGQGNYPYDFPYWIQQAFDDLQYDERGFDNPSITSQCALPVVEYTLFSITVEEGQALRFVQLPNLHELSMTCADGFSTTVYDDFVGGQADCTVTGTAEVEMRGYSRNYERNWDWTNDTYVWNDTPIDVLAEIPDVFKDPTWNYNHGNRNYWSVMTDMQPPWNHDGDTWIDYPPNTYTPLSFYVYFEMHFVQVHDSE